VDALAFSFTPTLRRSFELTPGYVAERVVSLS
jgi:hypothetical protein